MAAVEAAAANKAMMLFVAQNHKGRDAMNNSALVLIANELRKTADACFRARNDRDANLLLLIAEAFSNGLERAEQRAERS